MNEPAPGTIPVPGQQGVCDKMKAPIFIFGNPRSGTTLLRLMLTCHRNIVIPPECGFAVFFHDKYQDWQQIGYSNSLLDRFLDDLESARKIEHWKLNFGRLKDFLRQRRPDSYSSAVSAVYEWYGLSLGSSFERWGDKNNFYIHHISVIEVMFPNAFFVHLVRDGRTVACSYRNLAQSTINSVYAPQLPSDIEEIGAQWSRNIQTIRHALTARKWENSCELLFEDLVLDPEGTLRDLCHRLGEEYDPAMLQYHVRNREQELEPKEFLPWKEKNLQPLRSEEVGRYSDELSPDEIQRLEAVAGKELAQYGYL